MKALKIIGWITAGIVGVVALLSIINFFGLAQLTKESHFDLDAFEDYED
jgi:hypothetical protein